MARAIGIDLGTTNSCAAYVDDGTPTIITYPNGMKTIPSVFAIDKSGERLVGESAREQASANPMNTVAASKRLIGRSFGSESVDRMSQVFTYELVEGDESSVMVKVADQVMTLEQVSAAILERIKDNAEIVIGEKVDRAVITVPAYFNDRQRQAVRAAGRLAGLEVMRVLNEPTAAALAYGLGRQLNQRVAIYDLGGGTFDISLIDIKDRVFEVIATGGDTFLGGVDFDDRIMQQVLTEFLDEHAVDLSFDRAAITRIRDAAEQAKIDLSTERSAVIDIPAIFTDPMTGEVFDLYFELTRERLNDLTRDLVHRSIDTCKRILSEAGCGRDEVDELLLVGGQSRMPLVRAELEGFLGRPPSQKVHPDEAVAIGAAIMAHSLAQRSGPRQVTLHDVLPMAIGVSKRDGTMAVLFDKNRALPATETRVITTSKENQKSLMLRIYQGDRPTISHCELLGTFVFHGLRPAPRGEVRIEICFDIDSEGILKLIATDRDTGDVVESKLSLSRKDKPGKGKRKTPEPPPQLEMPSSPSMGAPTASADATATAPDASGDVATKPRPVPNPALAPSPEPEPNDPLRAALQRKSDADVPAETAQGFFARIWAAILGLFGR